TSHSTNTDVAPSKVRVSTELRKSKNKLAADFDTLVGDAEELLRTTANYSGQGYAAARATFEEHLDQIKGKISDADSFAMGKYREAVESTDSYVRTNPWQAIGITAAVGVLIGILASRR
ncbi:MAG TPA: DUF883 family protein, partial [Burkholderiaceae bacterium]|nr:DUF883 family protein [Burkholderiaceae bacterium]